MTTVLLALGLIAAPPPAGEPPLPAGPAARPGDELAELRARIARDMQIVEGRLKAGDAGDETRKLQKQIVDNLDHFLKKSREQPPSDPSPMNDQSAKPETSPSAGNPKPGAPKDGSTRRERREAQRRQLPGRPPAPQRAGAQPQSGPGQPNDPAGTISRNRARTGPADSMADVAKDIWGHLPESLRQEVDHYYREQFMPRYRDLLQQYYLRLAETERRSRPNP